MFWARGNAWATWFLVDVQLARRARGLDPDPELQRALLAQLGALRAAQDPSGLWRTDLLGPSEGNPLETSASALFVAAWTRARRAGLIGQSQADAQLLERARSGLRARVRWERGHPIVTGTSTGTSPFFTAVYRAVPLDENVGHGVGAMLLSLCPKLAE
jgi:rhamnogalacturonyl hydrolase YesR